MRFLLLQSTMEQILLHKNIGLQYKSLAAARADVARTNNGCSQHSKYLADMILF